MAPSPDHRSGAAGSPAAPAAFERLLAPLSPSTFLGEYWERKPLIISRDDPSYFSDLLSLPQLDRIIGSGWLVHPAIRMVRDGMDIPLADFTRNLISSGIEVTGVADPDLVFGQYRTGATIIVNHLHRNLPGLAEFCLDVESALGHRAQTNIYLTPPSAQGFAPHFDTHEVFILQIAGTKLWRIYDAPPIPLPLNEQGWRKLHGKDAVPPHDRLIEEREVRPGDVVYIPRGFVHEAKNVNAGLSLHVTLGVLVWTWARVISDAVRQLILADERFRQSLPVAFAEPANAAGLEAAAEGIRRDLAERLDLGSVVEALKQQSRRQSWFLLGGRLQELADVDAIGTETVLWRRPGVFPFLEEDGDVLRIVFNGKTLELPDVAFELAAALANERVIRVDSLLQPLGASVALTLLRSAVREGLLLIHPESAAAPT